MKIVIRFFCILFLLICANNLTAQNNQLQHYDTENGLPQSQVNDLLQDAFGYLWLGTQGGGLAKFDGNQFRVFSVQNGLPSNFINALFFKNDSLFIGTNNGLSIKINQLFINFKGPKVNKIISLKNSLYAATTQGIFEIKKDYLQPLEINVQLDIASINDFIFTGNFYWIATNKGLWKVDDLLHPKKVKLIHYQKYTALLSLKNNSFLATTNKEIILVKNGLISKKTIPIKNTNSLQFLKNQLWVATKNSGIYILNSNTFSVEKKIDNSTGLPFENVKKIIADAQQTHWIATDGNGLYKLTQNNFTRFKTANKLAGNSVLKISTTQNNVFGVTNKNELFKKDSTNFSVIKNPYPAFQITSIAVDKTGTIWTATNGGGLVMYQKKATDSTLTKQWQTETLNANNGFFYNNLLQVIPTDSAIWIATKSKGIIKLDYNFEQKFVKKIQVFNRHNGLTDTEINYMKTAKNGLLWYATKNGNLGCIKNDSVKNYSQILRQKTTITSLVFDKNRLFLGTLGNGIWVGNTNNLSEFTPLQTADNLNLKNVYQLILDSNHNLWASTENGLTKILLTKDNRANAALTFSKNDGFRGIGINAQAVAQDSLGNLWFGTTAGLIKYTATKTTDKHNKLHLFFEQFQVNFKVIDSINLNHQQKIVFLKPRENNLAFTFKTIDLKHPKSIQYHWKLNEQTSPWANTKSVEFANLKSGNYQFSIQSKNANQKSEWRNFSFFIDAPFYQKPWVQWTFIIILFLLLLAFILFYNRKTSKKKNAKIAQLQLEKHLIALEQKALQLQMNPHFIFNVLNGIKAQGNSGNKEQLNKTVSQFASLLRAVLHNSRSEEISLQQEIELLKNYVDLEQQINHQKFDFTIESTIKKLPLEEILIPPMLIQPFIENSIEHGIKNLPKKGTIKLNFIIKNDFLHCSIVDNGIGFKQTKREQKGNKHKSAAIKITRERIENLSGMQSFTIEELNDNSKVNGTKVWFKIPLKTDF